MPKSFILEMKKKLKINQANNGILYVIEYTEKSAHPTSVYPDSYCACWKDLCLLYRRLDSHSAVFWEDCWSVELGPSGASAWPA